MKKITTFLMMMVIITVSFGQKKENGTVYVEHPAIGIVKAMTKAFVEGDSSKVASYLSDDFKEFSGTSIVTNDKGTDKAAFAARAKGFHNQLSYFSIVDQKGAYADAIEYKDEEVKDVVWVQDWQEMKGVHKLTGVKISMPMHRIYGINKDNKIKTIITYANSSVNNEVRESFSDRTNGTIYNHHENINTVRKMIYGFENKDFENCYSYYDPAAIFIDMNYADNKGITLGEMKDKDQAFLKEFDLTSIDVVGYPDYLHYELGDARVVMSWWAYNLIRKSDKKPITLNVHFVDDFNAEGKIISETAYYNEALLKQ